MHISASTLVTVLLVAAAQDAVAASHGNGTHSASRDGTHPASREGSSTHLQSNSNSVPALSAIPPDVLAAQQSSAAAAASAIAAANAAAAASGLKQPPGLQAAGGSPVSLRPLPALGTGEAVAPPAVVESTTAATSVAVTQSAAVTTRSSSEGLVQLPGLSTAAPVSLVPLPNLSSVATLTATLDASSVASTTAVGVLPSLTPIAAGKSGAGVLTDSATAIAAAPSSFTTHTQGFVFSNGTQNVASGIAQATGGMGLVPLPNDAAASSSGSLKALPTNIGGSGISYNSGSESSSPSLKPLPGLSGASETPGASLKPLPNVASQTAGGSDALATPTGMVMTGTGSGTGTGSDSAGLNTLLTATTAGYGASTPTTLTTVGPDGVTSTLVTAVAAQTSALGGAAAGLLASNATATGMGGSVSSVTPGSSGAEGGAVAGARKGVVVALVAAAVGALGVLMM